MLKYILILEYLRKNEYNKENIFYRGKEKMALIKCPECGKEISDKAKKCPNCGYKIKNGFIDRRKMRIIIVAIFLVLVTLICVIVQKERKEQKVLEEQRQREIAEIDSWVEKVYGGEIPTQVEYDEMVERFNNLGEDQANIKNADILKKFEAIDLDTITQISDKIDSLDESSDFSKILEAKDDYEDLKENEKELVDIKKIDSLMELSDIENAALAACNNIKLCMKNEDSFKVNEITVKDDLEKMNFYWVLIEYSGTNSFGGNLDKTSCFGMSEDFEDPFFPLAQITGVSKYLDSTVSYNEYTKCEKPEISVDTDKITYYLEKE